MLKIYVCSFLLSALIVVEPLNINGRVGGNVTIKCFNWNSMTDVKSNDKYFCNSPCSTDKHIIIKAAFGKTESKNRIELTNGGNDLFVTFTNLQKSDSAKYYCGATRFGYDTFIEVNLKVTDAESSSPKKTPKTSAVTTSSTVSSSSSDFITDMSSSFNIHPTTTTPMTSSATQRAGRVPYLITGVIFILTILMMLLILMRKMMRKQLKEEDTREEVEYNEIRFEDQQTVSQPAGFSTTLYFSADPDSLYANYSYNQDTELAAERGNNYSKDLSGVNPRGACAESRVTAPQCDLVYDVVQLPKQQTEPTGQSEPNLSESNENDPLYSLAQLPQAT